MIKSLRCNRSTFHAIDFTPELNVILADRTKEETIKNSRNGLGKSTLIEIIHFCLGADFKGPITAEALQEWVFSLDLVIKDQEISVSRDTGSPTKISIRGDYASWPIKPEINEETGEFELTNKQWCQVLGALMFGLPNISKGKHQPKFRSLISYFIRRGKDAYSKPFEFFRKQPTASVQVLNTFLLGLGTEDAIEFQTLKERSQVLTQLRKLTSGGGSAKEFLGTLGELEAVKVRLERQTRNEERDLGEFRVHPQYEEITKQANRLTEEIHELVNENVFDKRLLELYDKSSKQETPPEAADVTRLYARAGIELPNTVKKRLEDVQQFHTSLVENRRSFLNAEMQRLGGAITSRINTVAQKTEERADLMKILQTHGALEEYTKLQQQHLKTRAELETVLHRIKDIQDLQEGVSALKIDREILVQRARRGLNERATVRDRAIELFNANSQALYEAPGNLVVDVDENGFQFKVDIRRSTSGGVGNMKIFCYDLMLAQLWAERSSSPGILIHDSIIFDGVDERQRALALQLAATEAKRCGFQYICTMNSDAVPRREFAEGFNFDSYVRLVLSDEDERSCLTGIRFEIEAKSEEKESEEDGQEEEHKE